jgi:predicted O-methyltransferase YrrM
MEFGTFTGRTAYNLALNTSEKIHTVDIGRNVDAQSNVAGLNYPDYTPGEVFISDPEVSDQIKLILGDSREIDFSPYYGKMGMVIVDGGHSYEVAKSDTEQALRMLRDGGIIVWDDYSPVWPGVMRAIDEFPARDQLLGFNREGLVIYFSRGPQSSGSLGSSILAGLQ